MNLLLYIETIIYKVYVRIFTYTSPILMPCPTEDWQWKERHITYTLPYTSKQAFNIITTCSHIYIQSSSEDIYSLYLCIYRDIFIVWYWMTLVTLLFVYLHIHTVTGCIAFFSIRIQHILCARSATLTFARAPINNLCTPDSEPKDRLGRSKHLQTS